MDFSLELLSGGVTDFHLGQDIFEVMAKSWDAAVSGKGSGRKR